MRGITRFVLGTLVVLFAVPAALTLIGAVAGIIEALNQRDPDLQLLAMGGAFWMLCVSFMLAIFPAFVALMMHMEHHLHRIDDRLIDISIAARSLRDMTLEDHKRRKAQTKENV